MIGDWSLELVTRSSQVYRDVVQLHPVQLRPPQQKNLLITAYMAVELAQINFGKGVAEIFKSSEAFLIVKKN